MKGYLIAAAVVLGAAWHWTGGFDSTKMLEQAKKNPQASWAPTLDYYVGIANFQKSNYPKCQEAFTQLLTDHPTSQYTARALARQADCAEYNRDWETAKTASGRYLEEFPDGKAYENMKKKLELLKYNHP